MSDYTLEDVLEFINGEIEDAYTEACKDLSTARKFVSDVRKLAKDYNANFFIVTDGASGYSNGNGKSNPAVKNARNNQIEWEKKHGFDPDEDWSNDCVDLLEFGNDIDTVYEGFFDKFKDRFKKKESKSMNNQTLNSTVKKYSDEELKILDNLKKDIIRFANEKFKLYIKDPKYRKDVLDYMSKCDLEEADLPNNLRFEIFDDRDPDFITLQIMDPSAGYVEQDINIALLRIFKAIGNNIDANPNFSKIAKIKSKDYGDGDEGCFSVGIELKDNEKESYNMSNHTLEEVIDFINSEIEDAYTEASKVDADIAAMGGKNFRKSIQKNFNNKGEFIPIKSTEPKGDAETVRRKNIRKKYSDFEYGNRGGNGKEYNGLYSPWTGRKISKENPTYHYHSKSGTAGKRQEPNSVLIPRSDNPHEKAHSKSNEKDSFRKLDMADRLAKRAAEKGFKNKDVEAKWKKFVDKYQETVESIYQAYEDDIISYESAYELLDLIDLDNYEFD